MNIKKILLALAAIAGVVGLIFIGKKLLSGKPAESSGDPVDGEEDIPVAGNGNSGSNSGSSNSGSNNGSSNSGGSTGTGNSGSTNVPTAGGSQTTNNAPSMSFGPCVNPPSSRGKYNQYGIAWDYVSQVDKIWPSGYAGLVDSDLDDCVHAALKAFDVNVNQNSVKVMRTDIERYLSSSARKSSLLEVIGSRRCA